MRRIALSAALVAAVPWILGAGCDLFSTRTPDVAEGTESLWQPPTTPKLVVTNLQVAFQAGNFTDYRRALTDDFTFVPDDADVAQMDLERPGEAVYENWDADVERATAEIIQGSAETVELSMTAFDEDIEGDNQLIKYNYALTLTPASGSAATYEGEAWFRIRQEPGGLWYIFEWVDVASSTTFDSWGLKKGRSRPLGGQAPRPPAPG